MSTPGGTPSGLTRTVYGQVPTEAARNLLKTFHTLTFHLFEAGRK